MGVNVGRVRECPINDIKYTILGHNTVIGAAGGSILNAELACKLGMIAWLDSQKQINVWYRSKNDNI